MNQMLSNSITCLREITCERNSPSMWQTLLSYFKKQPQPHQPSSHHHCDPLAAMNTEAGPTTTKKRTTCWKSQTISIFLSNCYLRYRHCVLDNAMYCMLNRLKYSVHITYTCPGTPESLFNTVCYDIHLITVVWNLQYL